MLRLLLLFALALPGQALAHASLLGSEPADGASLDSAPSSVVLRFDEAVALIALSLIGPDGHAVPLGSVDGRGGVVRASVPAGLPGGLYLLSWRVTSADSHPVAGTAAFGVGMVNRPVQAGPTAMDASIWAVPSQMARWLFYAVLMAAAGGSLFRAVVAEVPLHVRRSLAIAALFGTVLCAVQLGLRGALLAGVSPRGFWEAASWRPALGTTLATSLFVSGVGLLGCAVTLWKEGTTTLRVLGAMAGVLAVAGIPLSGHATTAEPRWLTAPSLALHTLAVAFWLGAFWPLLALLRGPTPPAAAVRRFSMLAVPTVALLVATGLVIAVVQVEHPAALGATNYGLLLLAKLAGVAGLITLAARNRLRLTPALDAGSPGAAARLYRSIGMEAALAGVVLAATSALTLAVPPRVSAHAGHSHAPQGIAVATEAGGLRASVEIVPGRAGLNRIAVTLSYAMAGLAPVPKEVWVDLSQGSIGPIRRRLTPQAEGNYVHDGAEMTIPGRWRVRIEVLLTDFVQENLSTEVEIR